jgi:hypothetical protein
MAVDHKRIQRLLGDEEASSDHSLQAQSLKRARGETPPHTLTAYEWEEWYKEHGIPPAHRRSPEKRAPWWRRLINLKWL